MAKFYLLSIFMTLAFSNISCDKNHPEPNTDQEAITNQERKDLLEVYPDIDLTRIKKIGEETLEYKNGQTARKVNYAVIDGDVAWRYPIIYKSDGSIERCFWEDDKCDAKEFDPKYKQVIEEAEKSVMERMKRENISGLGSCHTFWAWKKEYLKKKGIDWKSPSELNPGILYD